MKRCNNGHYFDETKHSICPHCGINIDLDFDITLPKRPNYNDLEKTVAKRNLGPPAEDKTVAIVKKKIGFDPVVGWLVCIEGPDKGKDYQIRNERNFIGRAGSMDIAITGDESISRENHAIVSYSPKKQQFRVYPGDSRGLVYLNDEEVITSSHLKLYDVIELGQTKLIFVPLCGENFQWEDGKRK